jgi:hypothetical protein
VSSSIFLLRVSFSTISEVSQVKPSLIVEIEMVAIVDDELHEGLVEAIIIGSKKDSSIKSHVMPTSHDTITLSLSCSRSKE